MIVIRSDLTIFCSIFIEICVCAHVLMKGFMRLEIGQNLLGIESEVAWVTPGTFTVENYPCAEDGKNCDGGGFISQKYVDPSTEIDVLESRLRGRK